ncbi:phosphatase domain-containing protein [Glutamicibacter sp. X7]
MAKLTITRGLPGSGKTTYAKAWVADDPEQRVRINRDALRMMLHFRQGKVPHLTEQAITKAAQDLARTYLRAGLDVIVDDTNLRQRHAREWATLAKISGADFAVEDFTGVPLETCLWQNKNRDMALHVPEDVIRDMHQKFIAGGPLEFPSADAPAVEQWEPWEPTKGLEDVYLVDIDGTIALCGDRDIYDGSKVHLDTVNEDVAYVVKFLALAGNRIVFMTGRSREFETETVQWLADNEFIGRFMKTELHMRPAGDKRKDSVVKHELFNEHIRGKYNVAGVFDDRNQVVEMWRAIGLTVFQVADGNF